MPLPEVTFHSMNFTVGHWFPRADYEAIDFNPPYQRGTVWTIDQRRALIKSLLMGLPIGAVVVSVLPYELTPEHYHYRIIDGKQRLETVRLFEADGFTIPVEWLPEESWQYGNDAPTEGDVVLSQAPYVRRIFEMSRAFPALEWHGAKEQTGWAEVPKRGYTDQFQRVPVWRERTNAELLRAEAEVFMLLNGGGTGQDPEHMAEVAKMAAGEE